LTELQIIDLGEVPAYSPVERIRGVPLFGDKAMITLVTFDPIAEAPPHSHPQEQLGVVVSGSVFIIERDDEHEVGPMMGYAIPSGVEHGARAGDQGAVVVEAFHPLRQDPGRQRRPEPDRV
jgi:quercetin dioxygenase-like cupin family protein